jgi:hypothetical protein
LLKRHLVAALLARVDQPDGQLTMPRGVNEVVPQHYSSDAGMRAKVGRRVGPRHLRRRADARVDEACELAELRAERDDRPTRRGPHHELREKPCVPEVDAESMSSNGMYTGYRSAVSPTSTPAEPIGIS